MLQDQAFRLEGPRGRWTSCRRSRCCSFRRSRTCRSTCR